MASNRGGYKPSQEADSYARHAQKEAWRVEREIRKQKADGIRSTKETKPKKQKKPKPSKPAKEPGKILTFDEWSALGFRINKGAKAEHRDKNGKPLFTALQVWKPRDGWKPKESPSTGVSGPGWGKPSSLVKEARERAEKRDKAEEAVHMHMPEDFEPEDFPEDSAPPW